MGPSPTTCANHLDIDLADLGITGGTVKLTYDSGEGQFRVSTEYTSPIKLTPAQSSCWHMIRMGSGMTASARAVSMSWPTVWGW